ncbi:MAG: type VI secretion system-associated protein TagO [Gammaproteobacteria bacterium]
MRLPGNDLKTELARCEAIQDALNRLECFDLLTRNLRLSPQSAAQSQQGSPSAMPAAANPSINNASSMGPVPESTTAEVSGWRVIIKRNDKGRVDSAILQIQATHGVGVGGDPVSLALRCISSETGAFINWESQVGSDSAPVTVAVGDGGSSRRNWTISPDGTMTYYPGNAVPFVESLLNARQLAARINPYGGHEISAAFDLSGLGTAIQPLRDACHW